MSRPLMIALTAASLLSGCYSNTWEIAITGHVFEDAGGGVLLPMGGERVSMCWNIATHVDVTDRRAEALTGCQTAALSSEGVFDTALYGIGGAFVESMAVDLAIGEQIVPGDLISRYVFEVNCESTYTYADEDSYVVVTEDPCQNDLYEAVSYNFIFPAGSGLEADPG